MSAAQALLHFLLLSCAICVPAGAGIAVCLRKGWIR